LQKIYLDLSNSTSELYFHYISLISLLKEKLNVAIDEEKVFKDVNYAVKMI